MKIRNVRFIFQKLCKQVCYEDNLTKGLYDQCQSHDLDLHSKSQLRLKLDEFLTRTIIVISRYGIQTAHDSRRMHGMLMLISVTLTLTLKTFVRLTLLVFPLALRSIFCLSFANLKLGKQNVCILQAEARD